MRKVSSSLLLGTLLSLWVQPLLSVLQVRSLKGEISTELKLERSLESVEEIYPLLPPNTPLSRIDFSKATIDDLKRLPLLFYSSHAIESQLVHVIRILRSSWDEADRFKMSLKIIIQGRSGPTPVPAKVTAAAASPALAIRKTTSSPMSPKSSKAEITSSKKSQSNTASAVETLSSSLVGMFLMEKHVTRDRPLSRSDGSTQTTLRPSSTRSTEKQNNNPTLKKKEPTIFDDDDDEDEDDSSDDDEYISEDSESESDSDSKDDSASESESESESEDENYTVKSPISKPDPSPIIKQGGMVSIPLSTPPPINNLIADFGKTTLDTTTITTTTTTNTTVKEQANSNVVVEPPPLKTVTRQNNRQQEYNPPIFSDSPPSQNVQPFRSPLMTRIRSNSKDANIDIELQEIKSWTTLLEN